MITGCLRGLWIGANRSKGSSSSRTPVVLVKIIGVRVHVVVDVLRTDRRDGMIRLHGVFTFSLTFPTATHVVTYAIDVVDDLKHIECAQVLVTIDVRELFDRRVRSGRERSPPPIVPWFIN